MARKSKLYPVKKRLIHGFLTFKGPNKIMDVIIWKCV